MKTKRATSAFTCLVAFAALGLLLQQSGLGRALTSSSERSSESKTQLSGTITHPAMQRGLAEQLKAFLAAPPPVEMLAELREETSPHTNAYYALLRYQTNAFFYREAPSLAELSSPNPSRGFRAAGYYGEDYWDFSYDGRTLESAPQGDESMRQVLNHVIYRASKLLNLGVFDALPGAIRWDGRRIRSFTNRYGTSLEGELTVLPNGQLEGLRLLARFGTNTVPWRIDYEFAPSANLPAYLPDKLTARHLRKGVWHPGFEVRFLQVHLPEAPLPKESFLPGAMASGATHQTLHTASGLVLGRSGPETTWHRVYTGPPAMLKVTRKLGLSVETVARCWDALPWCVGFGGLLLLALCGWAVFGRRRHAHCEVAGESPKS